MDSPRPKRARSSSFSSNSSEEEQQGTASAAPQGKIYRLDLTQQEEDSSDLTCHLPPTCHRLPSGQSFSSPQLLQAHRETYHVHLCHEREYFVQYESTREAGRARARAKKTEGEQECGRVFPEERLLELHRREVHDPLLAKVNQEGGKIYLCFHCSSLFRTPKGRRLHLVAKHSFPPSYFFGVTLHGIESRVKGGMLKSDSTRSKRREEEKKEEEMGKGDQEMGELSQKLEGSSIGLVPRSVRKKMVVEKQKQQMDVGA